ncbi:MAG: RidA family protein [Bacteroidota bacterium]
MKKIIYASAAPEPIGPYSQAVQVGDFVFVSGQIPIVPETGDIIMGDPSAATHQVMKNIGAILEELKLSFAHIVKTSIFLKDMEDFSTVNAAYGSYFSDSFPARETVEVSRLPKGVEVEISVIVFAK